MSQPVYSSILVKDADFAMVRIPKRYKWSPQSDITAYELALCMPVLLTIANHPLMDVEAYIPEDCLRHFTELGSGT